MMAACCGIENNLGRLVTPLRACYNKAQEQFFKDIPDFFFGLFCKIRHGHRDEKRRISELSAA